MGSIRDSLLKKYGNGNSVSTRRQEEVKETSIREQLEKKYSPENNAKREKAVSSWVGKYNAAIKNQSNLNGDEIDKLIREYDEIKDYARAYGLPNAQRYAQQLRMMREGIAQRQKRNMATALLHPEARVQRAGAPTIPSAVVKDAEPYKAQFERDNTYRQKYQGKTYDQLNAVISAMEDSKEKKWLRDYAPSVMTAEDYDKEIADTDTNLQSMQAELRQLVQKGSVDSFTSEEIDRAHYLQEEIKKLSQKKDQLDNERKYSFLYQNQDYKEKSGYVSTASEDWLTKTFGQYNLGYSDLTYEYINNQNGIRDKIRHEAATYRNSMDDFEIYDNLSENEAATYNYLYNTAGKESAEEYLKYLKPELNARKQDKTMLQAAAFATENPVLADITSVGATLTSGTGVLDALGQKIKNDIAGDYYKPIDMNTDAMTASIVSSTIRGTRAHNLADKYGTIQIDEEDHPILSRLFNGKSLGDVYQLGMSMVDSTATALLSPVLGSASTLLLAGSSATQTMLSAAENGASDEQALWMGALSGAFEYLFEKYELESLLKNGSESAVRAFVSQSLSEGLGEGMTTISNLVADTLIMADKSELNRTIEAYREQHPDWSEEKLRKEALKDLAIQTGWDVVGGTVSGGIMGGGYSVINKGIDKLHSLAQEKVDAEQQALQQLAEEMNGVEETENTVQMDGVKYSIKRTQNMSWDEQISGALKQGGSIVHSDTLVLDDTPVNLVKDGVENKRLAIPLSVITKAKNGKDSSHSINDQNLKNLQKGVRNAPIVINNPGRNALVFVTDIQQDGAPVLVAFQKNAQFDGDDVHKATSIHLQMDVASMLKALPAEATIYAKNESELDTAAGITDSLRSISANVKFTGNTVAENVAGVNGEISSAEGQVLRGSNPVQIADVESAGKGKLTVKLTDGSTADVSELSFPNMGEQELWRVLAEYSDNAEAARQLLKEYRAGDLKAFEFAKGVEEGFIYGKLNISEGEMAKRGSYVNLLNPMQRNMAYKYGQYAGEKQTRQRSAEASERNTKRERKGGVHYGYEGQKLDKSKLSKAQRVGVDFAERLARRKGITTYFYRSYVNERGQRVYKNREGNIVPADENGWYDPSDGSIHIDLNSGDMGSSVLFTMAHELTHFIQDWSADRYRTLCKILTEGYLDKGQSIDKLVRNKQEEYRKKNVELSYEEAFDEVIASSMEGVLSDGRVMDLLDDVETKDMSLADRIRSFLEETAELIRDTIQAYRGVKPETPEGRIVQRMQSIHNQLQEVFAAGLHEGGENYRQGGKINTAPIGGTKSSIRATEDGIKYVKLDGNIFLRSDGTEMTQTEAYNTLVGKSITLEDGDVITFIKNLPGRSVYNELFKKMPGYDPGIDVKAVSKAINKNIVEVIKASSVQIRNEKQRHPHIGIVDFDQREVYLADDQNAYRLEMCIANLTDGTKIAYVKRFIANPNPDVIAKIKKAETAVQNRLNQPSKTSIRTSNQKVNKNSIRYQKNALAQDQLRMENTNMSEDVSGLNELVAAQRQQGENGQLRRGALQASASMLMKKANAKGKQAELIELLDKFYQHVGSGQEMNWDGIRLKAKPVVDWLMDHVKRNKQVSEYAREVLAELRTSRIYLDESQKKEAAYLCGSFDAFRKMMMGSVTIANERSISLDSRWHELSQLYPDVFKEDVSAADMPRELAEIVNGMRNSDTSELEFEYYREFIVQDLLYDVYDSYWNASTLYNGEDQQSKFIKSLKGKHKQRMQEVYQRQWQRRAAMQEQKGLSPREMLVNQAESIAANSEEYAKLQTYRRKIQELNATEEQLRRLEEGLQKLFQAPGARDQKQIDALLALKQKALDKLNRYDSQLINLENSGPIQSIVSRMRNGAYQRGYTKAREHYQESRQRATERHDASQMRQKLKRVVRDLWKLQETAPKDRRTKEELREFVDSAIKTADLVWLERYDEYDMVRNGVGVDLRGDEPQLLQECRELLEKHLVISEAESRWDIEGALQAAKDKAALDKELGKRMKKLRDAGVFAEEFKRVHEMDVGQLIDNLIESYEKLNGTDSSYLQGAYQEVLPTKLQQIRNEIGAKPVRNMTLQELEQLYDAYSAVLHVVRNANKVFADNRAADVTALGTGVVGELEGFKRQKWSRMVIESLKKTGWNNLTPAYAFRQIGSGTLERLYKNLVNGMGTYGRDIAEAKLLWQAQAKKHGANNWDMEARTEFVDRTGKKFSLSLGQLMSLYALSKRQQALGHLEIGGIMLDTTEAYVENIIDKVLPKVMTNADTFKLDKAALEGICSKLTAQQKAFVDATQAYLSKDMSEKGNEVSMKLYGIRLFKEKHYFPLRTASQTRYESTELVDQHKLKNSGFTKEVTPKASNAVVLSDYSHVWTGHVKQMSLYHGMTLPMEDMDRVLNFGKTLAKDENGNVLKDEKGEVIPVFAVDSVSTTLQNIFGKHPEGYIRDLMKQLNGGVRADVAEDLSGKMMSRFKKAAVAASLSVWIQQWTSVFRSMAYVPMKYFFQKPMGTQRTAIIVEMKKYCPIAIIKEMGGFDTGIGNSEHDYITMAEPENMKQYVAEVKKHPMKRFDELTGWLPGRADETTWAHIWTAVKRETRDKHPSLRMGTDAFYKVAADRFTEVINLTQVYDSVLSKSALMRSKGGLAKMLTQFAAEPTLALNMAVDAMVQHQRTGKVQTGTALALVGSVVANAMSSALIYAMRDDDEEETFLEKYSASLLGNLLDGLNPLTYMPIIRDIWSMLQGYDVKRSDMEVWSQFGSSLEQIVRKYVDEDATDKERAEAWASAADWLLALFGVPTKNIRRELKGFGSLWGTLEQDLTTRATTAGSLKDTNYETFWSSVPLMRLIKGETKAEKLLDAHIAGDTHYADRLRSTYKDKTAADNAVVQTIKERFEEGKLSESDALYYLESYAGKTKEKAQNYLDKWNFAAAHPNVELTDGQRKGWGAYAEPAGISLEIYTQYVESTEGLTIKKDVVNVIHALPLTRRQKDALYLAEGYAESKLDEAPWN